MRLPRQLQDGVSLQQAGRNCLSNPVLYVVAIGDNRVQEINFAGY